MPQYALRTARFPVNNPATIKLTHYRQTSLQCALAGLSAAGHVIVQRIRPPSVRDVANDRAA
jgi:hypothetical protein